MKLIDNLKVKWHAYWNDEYEVTIWYVRESVHDDKGLMKMCTRMEPIVYNFSAISKKTNTHIVGIDMEKKPIEILTTVPFDYQIRKIC